MLKSEAIKVLTFCRNPLEQVWCYVDGKLLSFKDIKEDYELRWLSEFERRYQIVPVWLEFIEHNIWILAYRKANVKHIITWIKLLHR